MNDRVSTSLIISPFLVLAFISEIFLFLFLLSICILIIYETNLNTKNYARIYTYLLSIFIYFLLLLLNYNVLIFVVYISLLSFLISMFFNISCLRKNIEKLNCGEKTKIINLDIYKQQKSFALNEDFDFIFIDPPFKDKNFLKFIINLKKNNIINEKTVLIIHRHKNSFDDISSEIKVLKESAYGKSKIIFACLY